MNGNSVVVLFHYPDILFNVHIPMGHLWTRYINEDFIHCMSKSISLISTYSKGVLCCLLALLGDSLVGLLDIFYFANVFVPQS